MIPRLKKRADFTRLSKHGKKAVTPAFILLTSPNPQGPFVGFTASKKIGNAVARNLAKRRLRALVEKIMPKDYTQDVVLIARKAVLTRGFDDMEKDLTKVIKISV